MIVCVIIDGMNKQLFKVALVKLNTPACAIANQLGIDRATMSRIVNGWIIPKYEVQSKLAKALGVKVRDLFPIMRIESHK